VSADTWNDDRKRAVVFGAEAELYDRFRPTYPPALIDVLVALGAQTALDVGCGTGKLGRLLAERSVEVLGVEPDERMAEVARRHGLTVEVSRFEEWDPKDRRFDLVMSGQAWHWVDPEVGPGKAADLLKSGGSLAVIFTRHHFDPDVRSRLKEVYKRVVPDLNREPKHAGGDRSGRLVDPIERTGRFAPLQLSRFPWSATISRDDYLGELRTYSNHILLPSDRREELLEGVAAAIDETGGQLEVQYSTRLVLATSLRS